MRIIIDLQAAQACYRFEGIGRDALALAQAIVRQRGAHEVVLALNGLFADSIEPIRAAFDALLPQGNIVVWHTPAAVGTLAPDSQSRRALAECLREAFLASLAPDLVHLSNLFEGYADDAVTSIGAFAGQLPTSVMLHERRALGTAAGTPAYAGFYQHKRSQLARARLCLALSAAPLEAAASGAPAAVLLDLGAESPGRGWDALAAHAVAAFNALPALPAGDRTPVLPKLINAMSALLAPHRDDAMLRMLAHLLSRFPEADAPRQLLVDVSELVQRDARTGVQRVTRSILKQLLEAPPAGYQVVPVYARAEHPGYRYAHRFTARFQGVAAMREDSPIDYRPQDVFLGLDLQPAIIPAQQAYLQALQRDGVRICFVVYDLLPVLMPRHFPPGTEQGHHAWLDTLTLFDGAVCISRTVALELAAWQRAHAAPRLRPFCIGWFHLGADVDNSMPTRGMPPGAAALLAELACRPSFVTVGTVEPRKQHAQIVGAFELLWASGIDVNLVIVGKQGWMVDTLAKRLRAHAELGKRLFWLEGISDDFLAQVYAAADALIAASAGEGFGLPLIEAAQHKVAIIARALPVFTEVAGAHAFYFSGSQAADLAGAVGDWLDLHAAGRAPSSDDMPWVTWADSARQLLQVVLPAQAAHGQLLALPGAAPVAAPCVLMLAPYPVRRPRHGGQLRTWAMAAAYRQAGFVVHEVGFYQQEAYETADLAAHDVAFPQASPFRRYAAATVATLSDYLMGAFAVGDAEAFAQVRGSLPERVDVIQIEQPWLYALARRLQLETPQCRDALLVCSSQNIEEDMKRGILAAQDDTRVAQQAVADIAALEREAAREADLCVAVTLEDAAVLRSYGAAQVMHAANAISPWSADPERLASWRARLPQQPWPIFIASAHPPNFTGFIDVIGDSLACIPDGSKLVIAGGVGPHLERLLAASPSSSLNLARLQVLGVLDDVDLAAVKSLAHAFLLPIGAGGGSNIKTAEALYSGRPVVCTSTALRGFEQYRSLPEVTVADSPQAFQAAISAVLSPLTAVLEPVPACSLRAGLTWEACLVGVPQQVASMLAQRGSRA